MSWLAIIFLACLVGFFLAILFAPHEDVQHRSGDKRKSSAYVDGGAGWSVGSSGSSCDGGGSVGGDGGGACS